MFIKWTQPTIPPAQLLGVSGLVVGESPNQDSLAKTAREQGYAVYVETTVAKAKSAAADSEREGLAGVIVKTSESESTFGHAGKPNPGESADDLARSLRAAYPRLSVRLLKTGGKQPRLRGTLVVNRNGVIGVSSPTRQPWIDSNVALIRFEQAYGPGERPIYDFTWELMDAAEQQYGPPAEDYELAVAEAGAFHADVILPLESTLQEDLTHRKPQAWKKWTEIKRYIQFYSHATGEESLPVVSNIGVYTTDYDSSYEATNLMARHNIPYRIMSPRELTAGENYALALMIVFSPLNSAEIEAVDQFATRGGTAVLVGQQGGFPWHALAPLQRTPESVTYRAGKGKVVEISGPIIDPEPFAQDIWRLLADSDREMSLWNALTVLGVTYGDSAQAGTNLDLVNYSTEPIRVQVRLKGEFSRVRNETPEAGCCTSLKVNVRDGFTEFIVPRLRIGAVLHLVPAIR